jgi:hypothetical protein
MLKPVCVKCHRFYRMKRSGYYLIEGMPRGNLGRRVEPGIENDNDWQDYKLWCADFWECQGCGNQIISGSGMQPVSEHYKDDFADKKRITGVQFRVNDC